MKCFAPLLAASLILAPTAVFASLADSVADFSGVQGERGWFYGYSGRTLFAGSYDPTTQFALLPDFGGGSWTGYGRWTAIMPEWQHPTGTNTAGGPVWAVRRWQSDYEGAAMISGEAGLQSFTPEFISSLNSDILVNGQLVYSHAITSASIVPYAITTNLHLGDVVDFVTRSTPEDHYNWNRFTAKINAVPEPMSLSALALGLVGALRRSRRAKN